jgi:hypothetical protein
VRAGSTELWNWVNPTTASHPMHVHAADWVILSRSVFHYDATGAIVVDRTRARVCV